MDTRHIFIRVCVGEKKKVRVRNNMYVHMYTSMPQDTGKNDRIPVCVPNPFPAYVPDRLHELNMLGRIFSGNPFPPVSCEHEIVSSRPIPSTKWLPNIPCHSDQAVNKRKHCPILSIGKPSSILLRRARGPHHNTSGPARNTCILFQKHILLPIICLMSIYILYKSHVLFEETWSTNGTERP